MGNSVDIVGVFGDDVVHLHGNLYRVRRKRMRMAKSGLSVENGCLVYGNPRWFVNKSGDLEARGIESSKMEELKSSIKNSGLDNPIRVRPVRDGDRHCLEIVNGERRFRCITDLCDSDEKCHSTESSSKSPASEVFEWIDCRIDVMDDKAALGVALKTNETSEVIGDLASLQVVRALRGSGYQDQEILLSTGKSLSWLRETDRIIGLDEVCLDHFEKDQITRKAAIQLALIENAEERLSLLERIVGIARDRKASRLKSLDKKVEKADSDHFVNEANSELAAEEGDEDKAEMLADKSKSAKERGKKAREERGKVEAKAPKADARDIKKARGENAGGKKKSAGGHLMASYVELVEQVIQSEGFDEDGDSLGLNLETLSSVLGVLSAIIEGEEDAMSVLLANCPLDISEEESSDEEAESEDDEEEDKKIVRDELYNEFSDDEDDAAPDEEMEFRGAGFNEEEYD